MFLMLVDLTKCKRVSIFSDTKVNVTVPAYALRLNLTIWPINKALPSRCSCQLEKFAATAMMDLDENARAK